MEGTEIIARLPYKDPFLFVDALNRVDENGAEGSFTFSEDLPFFEGHFKGFPITPGVLLTECCAQIGMVCLGIYLAREEGTDGSLFVLSSSEMQFYIPVYPGEKVRVVSKKQYFRFSKLKCSVQMYNHQDQLVCSGTLSGMKIPGSNE